METWLVYVPAWSLSPGSKLLDMVFSPLTVSLKGTLITTFPELSFTVKAPSTIFSSEVWTTAVKNTLFPETDEEKLFT